MDRINISSSLTLALALGLASVPTAEARDWMSNLTLSDLCPALGADLCDPNEIAKRGGRTVPLEEIRQRVYTLRGKGICDNPAGGGYRCDSVNWDRVSSEVAANQQRGTAIKQIVDAPTDADAQRLVTELNKSCGRIGYSSCFDANKRILETRTRIQETRAANAATWAETQRLSAASLQQRAKERALTPADYGSIVSQTGEGAKIKWSELHPNAQAHLATMCREQGDRCHPNVQAAIAGQHDRLGAPVAPVDPNLARGADLVANAANAPGTTVWEGLNTDKDHKVLPAEVRSTLGDELTSRLGQQAADKTLTTEMTVNCTDRSKGCAKNDPFGSSMIQARDSMGLPKGEIYGDGGLVKYWQDATKLGGVEQDPRKIAGNKVQAPSREALVAAILADPKAPKVYADWANAEKKKMDEERAAREKQNPGTEGDPTKPKKQVEGEGDTTVASDQTGTGTSDQQLAGDPKPDEATGTSTVAENQEDPPAATQMAENTAAPVSATAMAYRPDV